MDWNYRNPNVLTERDSEGAVRLVQHLQYPFEGISNVYELVLAYIQLLQDVLRIPPEAIEHLDKTISALPGEGDSDAKPGLMLRWRLAFPVRDDSEVVLIQQTHAVERYKFGIDVEKAGLKVTINNRGGQWPRVTSLVSSLVPEPLDVDVLNDGLDAVTDEQVVSLLQNMVVKADFIKYGILPRFGLEARDDQEDATIRVYLHRYVPGNESPLRLSGNAAQPTPGRYYPAIALRITPGGPGTNLPGYELMSRIPDLTPLRADGLGTHSASVASPPGRGLVFMTDPVSETGDFGLRPGASLASLNAHRKFVLLENLQTPAAGSPWKLIGTHVQVLDSGVGNAGAVPGWLDIKPPTNSAGPFFAHPARTNNFAAVNAYYHVDGMFSLLDALGLPFTSFPMGYQLPAEVVHRAALHPGPCSDGRCVNAQALIFPLDVPGPYGRPVKHQWVQLRFALADLTRNPGSPQYPVEPLGMACDVRVVWHEFCHALIAASTDFLEFPFAHSAGDALAAIMGDPVSRLTEGPFGERYRGATFPWGRGPYRRHDRRPHKGWSWYSALGRMDGYNDDIRDMSGYAREQVLSSTLFRLYCCIGGDAKDAAGRPDRAVRRAAAVYTAYLIIRAIHSLGPRATVPTFDAEVFASAMRDADVGTLTVVPPLDRIGGTAHKVIRWAFEKQGLYLQGLPPLPEDGSGSPEPVDVFLDDGRTGEYQYTADWHALPMTVWNTTKPDPRRGDELPIVGMDNYIYVRVRNRGRDAAANVAVLVYGALGGQDTVWPDTSKWTSLPLGSGAVMSQNQAAAGDTLVFGPYCWRPNFAWSYSFLAQVDADGDRSNINPAGGLPCASGPTAVQILVLCDNNLGFRTMPAI